MSHGVTTALNSETPISYILEILGKKKVGKILHDILRIKPDEQCSMIFEDNRFDSRCSVIDSED